MIGVVFSLIFSIDLETYLPHLAISLVLWNLIQFSVIDSCQAFIGAERMIKQLPLPMLAYVFRVIWKNLVVAGHTFLVLPVVFIMFGTNINLNILFFPLGLMLVGANLSWLGVVLATLSARFRDVPPIIQSLMTMLFYVTPVIWVPEAIPEDYRAIVLGLNPAYHLMEVVRQPILGELPQAESVVTALLIGLIGIAAAGKILEKFGNRIAFWV